uniref:AC4 protein n=1 Tax=Papaya leaf crumple virus TaxID=928315 RepID=A0A5J6A4N9_9GEMI|nr:AC4 protein [Papaya leaf crumple virus]
MGNLIFTCSSSSKENTSAKITGSSTWYPQPGQHISIRTFRELSAGQVSSPISRRMETPSTGVSFRSMGDLQVEDNRQPVMLQPKHLMQAVSQKLLELLGS